MRASKRKPFPTGQAPRPDRREHLPSALRIRSQSGHNTLKSTRARLREAQGFPQKKFALMVGTAQSYLSDIEAGRVNVGFDLLCALPKVSMCRSALWAIETRTNGRNALSLSSRSGEHGPPDHYPVTSFCRDRTRSRSVACTPGRARPHGGCRRRRPPRSRCRGISAAGLRAPLRAG